MTKLSMSAKKNQLSEAYMQKQWWLIKMFPVPSAWLAAVDVCLHCTVTRTYDAVVTGCVCVWNLNTHRNEISLC